MKKLLCFFAFIALATSAKAQLTNGNVAYWKLDGNTLDATANNNNCIVSGAAQNQDGKIGSCYFFDGSNDYLDAASSTSLDITGSISISAWIKLNSNDYHTWGVWLMGKVPNSSSHVEPWMVYGIALDGSGYPSMTVAINNQNTVVSSNEELSISQWHHIVCVYDNTGNTMKVYVDTFLKGNVSTPSGAITSYATPFRIGINGGFDEAFDGHFDEIGIWNRALTTSEVDELYNGGDGISYPFDGGDTQYSLTTIVEPTGGGTVTPSGGNYSEGSDVVVTATPSNGYQFSGWSGDLTGATNPQTITMSSNKNVTATFVETSVTTYTLSTIIYGGGAISLDPPGGVYEEGTVVTVTAIPDDGFELTGWYSDGALIGRANNINFLLDTDYSITANFAYTSPLTYTLSTLAGSGGSISLSPPGGVYTALTVVKVTAVPDNGYQFDSWSGDLQGSSTITQIVYMISDKSITASFKENSGATYTLNASVEGGGSITLSPPGGVYDEGTSVTVTAVPGVGFEFQNWTGDLINSTNPQSLVMNTDKNISTKFIYTGSGISHWRTYFPGEIFYYGNIGIGTDDPKTELDVNGTVTATNFFKADGTPLGLWNTNSNGIHFLNGFVGINKDVPTTELDVNGTIKATNFVKSDGSLLVSWNENALGINYSGGNVGIGTTNPNYAVDIVGDLNLSGKLFLNDDVIFHKSNNTSSFSILSEYQENYTGSWNILVAPGNSITSGQFNTVLSSSSISITNGASNTLLGFWAGNQVETGWENVAVGASVLTN